MRPERQGFDQSLHMSSGLYLPEDSPDVVNAKLGFSGIDRMVWASMPYAATFNGGEKFPPDGYLTDYYTDEAVKAIAANRNRPFFLYLAHWGKLCRSRRIRLLAELTGVRCRGEKPGTPTRQR